MKVYKKALIIALCLIFGIISFGCAKNTVKQGEILRLHIRANSNLEADQQVKLKVRDKISAYLEGELKSVTSLKTAKKEIEKRKGTIKSLADLVLKQNGFSYESKVRVNNEFFPTRMYEDLVVESGYYDALIIELGSGQGDNWWCVIYPPLCYIEAELGTGFKYKSKIKELIKKYFG